MKTIFTIAAVAALATLAACSETAPAPTDNTSTDASDVAVDCGPKCQEHIENHK
jgi:ABC-type glycerol-3-phosphate transport system substrate-binding protein